MFFLAISFSAPRTTRLARSPSLVKIGSLVKNCKIFAYSNRKNSFKDYNVFLASLLKCFWHRQCLLCCTCTRNLTTYLKKNCAVSTKVVYFCLPVRNCSPFRSTRVHPQFLVGFVLLDLQFFMQCFVDRCLSFCPFSFFNFAVCPSIYRF